MNRRRFLAALGVGVTAANLPLLYKHYQRDANVSAVAERPVPVQLPQPTVTFEVAEQPPQESLAQVDEPIEELHNPTDSVLEQQDAAIKDYLFRMRHPDNHYEGDLKAQGRQRQLLQSIYQRIDRTKRVVGYGNFNVLCFDEMLTYARRYSKIGAFTKAELAYIEELFYQDASIYGFFGRKPIDKLTARVSEREVTKVPYTGHYLYRGDSMKLYHTLRKEVGESVTLTSGIRSIVKQMHLFLAKATSHDCNLSLASRSLAPPGYSFHGVGDFDVGKVGFGARNFTSDFAETEEFRRLVDSGYVDIRYPDGNQLGVRFEPWHIKVI